MSARTATAGLAIVAMLALMIGLVALLR